MKVIIFAAMAMLASSAHALETCRFESTTAWSGFYPHQSYTVYAGTNSEALFEEDIGDQFVDKLAELDGKICNVDWSEAKLYARNLNDNNVYLSTDVDVEQARAKQNPEVRKAFEIKRHNDLATRRAMARLVCEYEPGIADKDKCIDDYMKYTEKH